VIQKAAENALCAVGPGLPRLPGPGRGFYDEVMPTAEKCLAYGRFLGQRYRSFDNIIWVRGRPRPRAARENVDMVAYGIRESDRRHLMTAHCTAMPPGGAISGSWLEVSTSYAYEIVHLRLTWDYERKPAMPLFSSNPSMRGAQFIGAADPPSGLLVRALRRVRPCDGQLSDLVLQPGWQAALESPGRPRSCTGVGCSAHGRGSSWCPTRPQDRDRGSREFWGSTT